MEYMDSKFINATGRRKTAIARVFLEVKSKKSGISTVIIIYF